MEIIKVILTSLLSAVVLFLLAKIMGHKQISQLDLQNCSHCCLFCTRLPAC